MINICVHRSSNTWFPYHFGGIVHLCYHFLTYVYRFASNTPRRVASRTPVRTCVHIVRESLSKKKQQVSRLAYMYAYLAVQITTYILYVVLRLRPEKYDTNAIILNVSLFNDSHKFTTCMTIVPLNWPWTSPHRKDVGPWITTFALPGKINFFQPGSEWDRYPPQGGKMPITFYCFFFTNNLSVRCIHKITFSWPD